MKDSTNTQPQEMNRDEVVMKLVDLEIKKIKEDIHTDVSVLGEYLEHGFVGFANFTNAMLENHYLEDFKERITIK